MFYFLLLCQKKYPQCSNNKQRIHVQTGYCFLSQDEFRASLAVMTEMLSFPIFQWRISVSRFWLIKQENTKKLNYFNSHKFFQLLHEILLTQSNLRSGPQLEIPLLWYLDFQVFSNWKRKMTVLNPCGMHLFSHILTGTGILREICLEEPVNWLLFFEIMLKNFLQEIIELF